MYRRPPRLRRGSGLEYGSGDPGSIPSCPHRVRKRPLAAHCMGARQRLPMAWVPDSRTKLETGHRSRYYIAEISLNVTLNRNKPTQTNRQTDIRRTN